MIYKPFKAIVIILVTIGLCEIVVRVSGVYNTYSEKNFNRFDSYYGKTMPTYYHVYKPNEIINNYQTEFKYNKKSNAIGLINEDISEVKEHDEKRILILGDSFIEGVGASQDSSMPALLQRKISINSNKKLEVINAGIVGSDVFFQYYLFKDKLLQLKPDVVILNFNYSDFSDYIFRGGFNRFKNNGTVKFNDAPKIEKYYKHSHLLRAVLHFIFKYDFTLLPQKKLLKQYSLANNEIYNAIQQINKLCFENNIKFIVTIQPYPFSYIKHIPYYEYVDLIVNKLQQSNIKYVNTYEAFDKILNKENCLNYSWKYDGHFNAKGYLLFAEIVYDEIHKKYPEVWHSAIH